LDESVEVCAFATGAGMNSGPLRPHPCRMMANNNIMPSERMATFFLGNKTGAII